MLAGEFPNTLQKAALENDVPFKFGVHFQIAAVSQVSQVEMFQVVRKGPAMKEARKYHLPRDSNMIW